MRLTHRAIPASNAKVEEQELAQSLREVYTGSADVAQRAKPDRKPGPQLSRQYTEWLMVVDVAFELALAEQLQLDKEMVAVQYTTFKRILGMLQDRGTDGGVLTPTELEVLKSAEAIMTVLLHITGASNAVASSLSTVDAALDTLTSIATTLRDQPSHRPTQLDILPQWKTYHESYLSLELALVLSGLAAKLAVAKNSHASALKTLATSLFAAVQESFGRYKRVVDDLGSGGYETDELVKLLLGGGQDGTESSGEGEIQDGVGRAVGEFVGERSVRRSLLGYVQAAKVAVDAVLSVKMGK